MQSKGFRQLIALLNDLPRVQREALLTALHSKLSPAAALKLIETRFEAAPECGHCGSEHVGGWSTANRTKRYRCKDCGRTFNAFTGTPLAQLHRRESWLAYGRALSEGASLRKAAKRCGITLDTSFRWRHRLSKAATQAAGDAVDGVGPGDETASSEEVEGAQSEKRRARRQAHAVETPHACECPTSAGLSGGNARPTGARPGAVLAASNAAACDCDCHGVAGAPPPRPLVVALSAVVESHAIRWGGQLLRRGDNGSEH